MKNTAIVFHNYKRPLDLIKNNINSIKETYFTENKPTIMVASDRKLKEVDVTNIIDIADIELYRYETPSTITKTKNSIINQVTASFPHIKYLFIVEDDVNVLSPMVYQEYIDFMDKTGIGLMGYGFGHKLNHVFTKINPRLKFICKDSKTFVMYQYPCQVFLCFNLKINKELFNEELDHFVFKEYYSRLKEKNLIPFLGIYFDIAESWNKIEVDAEFSKKYPTDRTKTEESIQKELDITKQLNVEYKTENNLEIIINWIKDKGF